MKRQTRRAMVRRAAGGAFQRFSMRDMVEMRRRAPWSATALLVACAFGAQAWAQGAPGGQQSGSGGSTSSGANIQTVQQVQQQLQAPGPSVTPSSGADQSFRGSLVRDKATAEVLPLSLDDAIQRGLKDNLGLILQSSNV